MTALSGKDLGWYTLGSSSMKSSITSAREIGNLTNKMHKSTQPFAKRELEISPKHAREQKTLVKHFC